MSLDVADKWKVGRKDLESRVFQYRKLTKVCVSLFLPKKSYILVKWPV